MPKTTTEYKARDFTVRVRRVETWLGRAEHAHQSDDPDVAFILYWIAFNAAYAEDLASDSTTDSPTEPPLAIDAIKKYIGRVWAADPNRTIRDAIWNECRRRIESVVEIEYLFDPYWDDANEIPTDYYWKDRFDENLGFVHDALATHRYAGTRRILRIVFGRLYTLRNQIVHGGARWKSEYNRDSVLDATRIMASLVPAFLAVMHANPNREWGQPYYRPGLHGRTPSILRRLRRTARITDR